MICLILLAVMIGVVPFPSPLRERAALLFIAGQAMLSYATSGIAKLVSPTWREGRALPMIFSTIAHGDPQLGALLSRHCGLAWMMGWGVILFECSFVFFVGGPPALLLVALGAGFAFHLACALMMGLNGFLWGFPAAYPCVVALNSLLH